MGMKLVRQAIGERMKLAASASGWDHPRDIAARMEVSETTVYRWWSGDRLPTDERIEEYARLVGTEVSVFYGEHLFEPSISEALVGVSPGDWLLLTEAERAAIRVMVRGLAELRRREEGPLSPPLPGAE